MKPFVVAQLFGAAVAILTLDAIIAFASGRFRIGRHGSVLTLTGSAAYFAAGGALALAVIFGVLCVKKVRQGLRERPYRIDYP